MNRKEIFKIKKAIRDTRYAWLVCKSEGKYVLADTYAHKLKLLKEKLRQIKTYKTA